MRPLVHPSPPASGLAPGSPINDNLVTITTDGTPIPGAIERPISDKVGEWISVKDFGAVGDGVTDDTAAIQDALDAAGAKSLQTSTGITDQNFPSKGGDIVLAPAGEYSITQIEVPDHVALIGAGDTSTLFTSTYDGAIIRNKAAVGVGTGDKSGIYMAGFAVQGDRTKTNQIGIDTLRLFDGMIYRVRVYKCGSHGLVLREAITTTVSRVSSTNNIGAGIVLDEGVNGWDDLTASGLPANANIINNCHSFFNDAAGLLIKGLANGNTVLGGSYESNYLASGNNVGYNIEFTATAYTVNSLNNVWSEGAVKSHIYMNAATSAGYLEINGLRHFGQGASGAVDRAVIVDSGTALLNNCVGHSTAYKTISGSNKPFRFKAAGGAAVLRVVNCNGSGISDQNFVEDETGSTAASSAARQMWYNRGPHGIDFGATQTQSGANILDAYTEGTWTPVLTASTPGDLSVTYTTQKGFYTRVGRLVTLHFHIVTSAFTHTTASGALKLTGVPLASDNTTGMIAQSSLTFSGVTKSGYTQVSGFLDQNATQILFEASGSGQTAGNVAVTEAPTSGAVVLKGQLSYMVPT